MTALRDHAAALIFFAIASAFLGSLAAIGSIPGHTALVAFLGVLAAVATAVGVKYGAAAAIATAAPPAKTTTTSSSSSSGAA